MNSVRASSVALALAILWPICAAAQTQDFRVFIDKSNTAPGSTVSVSIGLPLKAASKTLPKGYSNPTAFYLACTAKDETANWKTGLGAEVFCDLKDQQTKIAHSKTESVEDIASGSSPTHTFAEKITLPKNPVGTKLWIIVRLDYNFPGLEPGNHKSLYASTTLLYRCEKSGACSYYTPNAYAKYLRTQEASKVNKP